MFWSQLFHHSHKTNHTFQQKFQVSGSFSVTQNAQVIKQFKIIMSGTTVRNVNYYFKQSLKYICRPNDVLLRLEAKDNGNKFDYLLYYIVTYSKK